jgi:AcrR family transcriptional regulator
VPAPKHTLDLLWRRTAPQAPARRGRRQGLSVDAVIDTAVQLADAEGLDATTMRRVAQALGVVPMTLYTYVPDKAALLDLMLDHVYLAMPRADTTGRSWRQRLAAVAEENRTLYDRHPWAARLSRSRPPLGPGQMTKYEHELRAFDDAGLDEVETDAALTYLLGFVQASARTAADARDAARRSARTDAQWWAENGPLLDRVFDAQAYPTAARIGAVAGEALGAAFDPDHAYEFGLHRVLDGLGVLIETRALAVTDAAAGPRPGDVRSDL